MSNVIEVKNLHKAFVTNTVLDDINFTVAKGEKVVLIGPSGGGKSTLLRCLIRLEEDYTGEVNFEGKNVSQANKDQLQTLLSLSGRTFY